MERGSVNYRLFAGIPPQGVEGLLKAGRIRSYKKGDEVLSEGQDHDGLFLIESGGVEVFRAGEEPGGSEGTGVEESLTRFRTGNFFGELAVFDPAPASASVRTTQDSALIKIPREALRSFLAQEPAVAVRFYRNLLSELATRLRKLDQKLIERIVWVHEPRENMEGEAV